MQQAEQSKCILSIKEVHKRFAGVHALKGVSLDLYDGEVLALIGENGAGKSTLMRVLMGIERRDSGTIVCHGEEINLSKPIEAYEYGIGMVFQEQALFPNLTVGENIFLGHEQELQKWGILNWKKIFQEAKMALEKVGLGEIDPRTMLSKLSFSERQMVEIARVLYPAFRLNRKGIIILDEPTTVLSPQEVEHLFEIVNSLRTHASFIFISHHLDEVVKYTDRVAVLKDGGNVGERLTKDVDIKTLQEMMVGREFSTDFYFAKDLRKPDEEVVLRLEGVTTKDVSDVSFSLHKGEILGLAGLMGCGKEEVPKIIFGDIPMLKGSITFGKDTPLGNRIQAAVNAGLGYLPSDRRNEGILDILSVGANTTIANLDHFCKVAGVLDHKKEQDEAQEYVQRLKVKTPSLKTRMMSLSGGNQQKVILAPLAQPQAQHPADGAAHPWHRRRRQTGDLSPDARNGERGDLHFGGLRRAARADRAVQPDRHHAPRHRHRGNRLPKGGKAK